MNDIQPSTLPSSAKGVWVGPLLVIAIAAILVWKPVDPSSHAEELATLSGPRLSGSLSVSEQLEIEVRLKPMHDDARRQRFDGAALAKRLGLDEGEPWRLTLVAPGELPSTVLSDVQVLEGGRQCLTPLVAEANAADGAVQDPLLALFRGPSDESVAGELELVLWGQAPSFDGQLQCSWGSASLLPEAAEEGRDGSIVTGAEDAPADAIIQD